MTPTVMQLATELDEQKQAVLALADAPIIETSPELGVIITRIDAFLWNPLPVGVTAAEAKRIAKERHQKAVEQVAALLPVTSQESYEIVALHAKWCASTCSSIGKWWAGLKKKAYESHQSLCEREARELAPKEIIQEACTLNMNNFLAAQERERRRKEREEADRAEAERKRLDAEAAAQQTEQDRIAREAAAALKKGDVRAAAELSEQAEAAAEQVQATKEEAAAVTEMAVVSSAPKVAGITPRKKWKAKPKGASEIWTQGALEVWTPQEIDKATLELCKAVVAGTIPLRYLTPQRGGPDTMQPIVEVNMAVLGNLAVRQQASMNIPGWEAVEESGLAVSAR